MIPHSILYAEGSNDAVTYDTTVYTITVTVADDGTAQLAVTAEGAEGIVFTNVYDDSYGEDEDPNDPNNPHAPYEDEDDEDGPDTPHSPYTGDDRHTAYWLLLSMLSAAGIVLLNSKRREDE